MLSFVVPAHNEEALLRQTLDSIEAAMAGVDEAHEVLVVDDASTDSTAAIAASTGARVIPVTARQISAARNAGARVAVGDAFVFVDADTRVTPQVVAAARLALQAGAVGGGCAVDFDGRLPLWARLLVPVARWGCRVGGMAAGCFVFCTRRAFFAVGGFDESLFAGEEAVLSARLRRLGRFVILRERVITSGRKLRTHSGWEIACMVGRFARRGRRVLTERQQLGLWYGPRRPDPQPPGPGDAAARDPSRS